MSGLSKIVPIIILLAIFMVFSSYAVGVLSENDDQINVSGTAYNDTHESNTRVQLATLTLFTPLAMILGVLALILVLKEFGKK